MEKNWYKEVLDVLGMRDEKRRILNRLNKIKAHTDDEYLQRLIKSAMDGIDAANATMTHAPVNELTSIRAAVPLLKYCRVKAKPPAD